MVSGGYGRSYTSTASTEILVHSEPSWRVVKPLPLAMSGLKLVNLNNVIYALGKYALNICQIKNFIYV